MLSHWSTIQGVADLELHHLYRAMAWLGESLPQDQQDGATPFAPRTNKDRIEEALFQRRRDLFSDLEIVFFDTTSIYFEGEGGETIGQRGHSKDHRPDLKQMVVGMVLDSNGNPVCSELWPGNTADVKSLVPIMERLQSRFGIGSVCIVADRGMISAETLAEVERRKWSYILGVRMRSSTEARAVLTTNMDLPAPEVALKYKQLWRVEDVFRSMKSLLDTRPIYHKCDEAIRGHVFCSFLALLLRKELDDRLARKGWKLEWADVVRDLDNLVEMEVAINGKGYVFRSQSSGVAGKVFQACGVALPPVLRSC
ncbi:MAG: IS1634 family transposase [Acidobacteriaceae bacterium]